jgi:5-oxoprolinase (ATP-hydrolysing)/N-methylhydantoinase A
MFENRTPLLVERKELIPDSGGAGRQRGGLGQRVQVRKLYDDGQPALVSLHPQGIEVDTPGHFGGRAGRRAAIRVTDGDSVREHAALGGLADLRSPSQLLTIELAGGSGYGDPGERPLDEVRRDLEEGSVTETGLGLYGCRLLPDGRVVREGE